MNTVIVYYSMSGNTAFLAREVAAQIHAELLEIKPAKHYPDKGLGKFFWGGKSAVMAETPALAPYTFHPGDYDQIIFGFPVWAGNITPPLRTFVRDNLTGLKGRRICAFACQSGAGAEKAFDKLAACLGIDGFEATLVLNDPKDRPDPGNDAKIMDFCERCRRLQVAGKPQG